MTDSLKPKLESVAKAYSDETGQKLQVTSGYRSPARQAQAMYNNIVQNGEGDVDKYANQTAAQEILRAYQANRGNETAAVNATTRVIERQIGNRTYISNHLRSNAIDVSADTNGAAFRRAVGAEGGRVLNEGDHLHAELG